MKRFVYIALIASAIALTGCTAKPANHAEMTINKEQVRAHNSQPSKLQNKLVINSVTGGKETHPLWCSTLDDNNFRTALDDSLKQCDYMAAETQNAQYKLDAEVLDVDHPMLGFNVTTKAVIKYKVTDTQSNAVILDDKIETKYSAKVSDALYGPTRLRLAIEGVVRNNIKALIEKLDAIS